ncbi:MAG: tol-pal system protein YbgF [Rhodobacter sp.]|nr:tol-pal system protein YbgF [Rhodobacter sp.]
MTALLLAGLATPAPLLAQGETLADIRQELSVLFVDIQRLKRELSTTGGVTSAVGGDTLQRVDLIESELQRLTSMTENLEFRIGRVVEDGTNRIGDLDFRLCELEPKCDIATLGSTPRLGGEPEGGTPVAATPQTTPDIQMAVGEQADFDAARSALDAGDFRRAADLFQTFTETYTGGPLTAEAHYFRGQALSGLGETSGAARAYLTAFSGNPDGPRAPDALLQLGTSLAELGQSNEACVTLAEVGARFQGMPQVVSAETERQRLGCQ